MTLAGEEGDSGSMAHSRDTIPLPALPNWVAGEEEGQCLHGMHVAVKRWSYSGLGARVQEAPRQQKVSASPWRAHRGQKAVKEWRSNSVWYQLLLRVHVTLDELGANADVEQPLLAVGDPLLMVLGPGIVVGGNEVLDLHLCARV